MENKQTRGHLAAFLTILIWGTTFVSTKVLLRDFQPVEILFSRFLLGLIALFIVCPRRLKGTTLKQELTFAGAGLFGITLYYLFENIALTYTSASNVGVITTTAPFFTAILALLFLKEERKGLWFYIGFLLAITGVCLISFNGTTLHLDPKGDLLALIAALTWGFYSILMKKITGFGYSTLLVTRRVFEYGLVIMIPALFLFGFDPDPRQIIDLVNLGNLVFLGLGASALCFVTWNYAVKILGAVRTSVYIYLTPAVTVIMAFLILREPITLMLLAGMALTLAGLVVSERK